MNSYTKLKEGWGLRVSGKPEAGSNVTVRTKAGAVKTETIGKVIWTGPDKYGPGTVSLCTIKANDNSAHQKRESHAGEVRCRFCHQWTPEGDDWCMACGKAGYE